MSNKKVVSQFDWDDYHNMVTYSRLWPVVREEADGTWRDIRHGGWVARLLAWVRGE